MKRVNPHHDPKHRSECWSWKYGVTKLPNKDNEFRKYDNIKWEHRKWVERESLEDKLYKAIQKERDEWRIPYGIVEAEDYRYDVPDDQKKYKKQNWTPEDQQSIRELLAEDDAKYRGTWMAKGRGGYYRVRVPSLKRTDREWINFYRTFPSIAIEVATGKERFLNGAKLKYIPLFKQILDEEWPENLQMWTDKQYEDLMKKGILEPYKQEILKNLIDD